MNSYFETIKLKINSLISEKAPIDIVDLWVYFLETKNIVIVPNC